MPESEETPGGALSPEEYRAAEGLDSAKPVPFEQAESDLDYEDALPDLVQRELDRLNVWANERGLDRGTMPAGHPEAPKVPHASAENRTEVTGGMHQPVESDASEEEEESEEQGPMVTAYREGFTEYRAALEEADARMRSEPHATETIRAYLQLRDTHRIRFTDLGIHIDAGQWTDPAVIKAKFASAVSELHDFTHSHPANS